MYLSLFLLSRKVDHVSFNKISNTYEGMICDKNGEGVVEGVEGQEPAVVRLIHELVTVHPRGGQPVAC